MIDQVPDVYISFDSQEGMEYLNNFKNFNFLEIFEIKKKIKISKT